ncbi:MAG: hypothetical protein JW774_01305, partial [Candidatus Aureabacteria bacterium]|nr:hypothetical protein [Candidatus Auribacterota bacterium]
MKKIKYLIFLFLGLVLTGLMAPVWMPLVTEKIIFPFLAKSIHIVSITGLTRIHCEELVLSDLKMGLKEKSFLEVDSLKTLYSPDRLIKKQIKGIEIQGMRVNMEWTSGRFILPGFDFNALFSVSSKAQQEASLPWKIGSVKIEDSSFQIHMDGKTFKIPFEFFSQCSFPESDGKTCLIHSELKLKLEGFPMQAELSGQTCFANGNISSKGEFKLRIDSGSLGFFHLSCTEGFTCTLYYSAEFQSDGIRQCEIHSDTGQESLVKFQGPWGNIFSGLPSVSFTVVNNPVQGRGSLKGDLSIREITWNDLKGE